METLQVSTSTTRRELHLTSSTHFDGTSLPPHFEVLGVLDSHSSSCWHPLSYWGVSKAAVCKHLDEMMEDREGSRMMLVIITSVLLESGENPKPRLGDGLGHRRAVCGAFPLNRFVRARTITPCLTSTSSISHESRVRFNAMLPELRMSPTISQLLSSTIHMERRIDPTVWFSCTTIMSKQPKCCGYRGELELQAR